MIPFSASITESTISGDFKAFGGENGFGANDAPVPIFLGNDHSLTEGVSPEPERSGTIAASSLSSESVISIDSPMINSSPIASSGSPEAMVSLPALSDQSLDESSDSGTGDKLLATLLPFNGEGREVFGTVLIGIFFDPPKMGGFAAKPAPFDGGFKNGEDDVIESVFDGNLSPWTTSMDASPLSVDLRGDGKPRFNLSVSDIASSSPTSFLNGCF
mmetsp:Transcript_13972/g.33884  ORF Transcript_13972/g.33884 Transcript_13972/m.33884 type:complete len:216 (+) Transcript_13972:2319-2966(+)